MKEYVLTNNYSFYGTFFINEEKYSGFFEYSPANGCKINLLSVKSKQLPQEHAEIIQGVVIDVKDKTKILITMIDCMFHPLSLYGQDVRTTLIIPTYVFLSERVFLDFETTNQLKLMAEYNVWPEFVHPQGFINTKKYENELLNFRITDDDYIALRESITSYDIYDFRAEHIFLAPENYLSKITSLIKPVIEEAKNNAHDYKDEIYYKKQGSHQCYIEFGKDISVLNNELLKIIINKSWIFENLLAMLTNDINTSLYKLKLISKSQNDAGSFCVLYNPVRIKDKDKISYDNRLSAFNLKKIPVEVMKTIIKNYYLKFDEKLSDFIMALNINANEDFGYFHISRILDCLDFIARIKNYDDDKYGKVIKSWVRDEKLLKKIESLFTDIAAGENIGKIISNIRASIVHPKLDNPKPNIFKLLHIYPLFRLAVIDYIFDEIEMPLESRNDYKDYYLNYHYSFK